MLRRLKPISPVIIRQFSSTPQSNQCNSLEKLTSRVSELEQQVKILNRENQNDYEKPLFQFQRKSKPSTDPENDKYKYEIDFTVNKGQFIGGIFLLIIGYGIFIK